MEKRKLTQFKPGQSGNPGGKPHIKNLAEVMEMARAHTPAAIAALARIVNSEDAPPATVVSAAVALLDRGWGKPVQPTEHAAEGGGPLFPTLSVVIKRE